MIRIDTVREFARRMTRNERGMTLIEIMIVLAIMAAVMGGVLVAVDQGTQRARANETRTKAAQVLSAVSEVRIIAPREEPSISELQAQGYLAESQTYDAWGNEFRIEYGSEGVSVTSGGRDGSLGGEDDITVTSGN